MYLSSLIFFTSTVSSASDSTLKHLKPRIASLSTEAIRYNAPWQPPAPDSSSGRCGPLKALVNMLFTTTLGIIDFFPIAGSWGMAGPWPPWTMVDDSWRATWGDPVAISEPSDSGRQGTWYCLQVAGCCRMLQVVAGCCRFLTKQQCQLNSSVARCAEFWGCCAVPDRIHASGQGWQSAAKHSTTQWVPANGDTTSATNLKKYEESKWFWNLKIWRWWTFLPTLSPNWSSCTLAFWVIGESWEYHDHKCHVRNTN